MAYRNMKRIIENSDIDYRYSMNATELCVLCSEDPVDAVMDAFTYGYELGKRAEKAKEKKA